MPASAIDSNPADRASACLTDLSPDKVGQLKSAAWVNSVSAPTHSDTVS